MEEVLRYDLELETNKPFISSENSPSNSNSNSNSKSKENAIERKRWLFCNDEKRINFSNGNNFIPVPLDEKDEYLRIMNKINYHASILNFNDGFDQLNANDFDLSFKDYVLYKLHAKKSVRGFLFSQGFQMTYSDPKLYAALVILRIIAGFGSAEAAFFTDPHRFKEGAGSLVDKIYNEIVSDHADYVEIHYDSAVSLIEFLPGPSDAKENENKNENDEDDATDVTDDDGGLSFYDLETNSFDDVNPVSGILTSRGQLEELVDIDTRRKQEKNLRDAYHVKIQTQNGDIYSVSNLFFTSVKYMKTTFDLFIL